MFLIAAVFAAGVALGFLLGRFSAPSPSPPSTPPAPPIPPPVIGSFDAHPRHICPRDRLQAITATWSGVERADAMRLVADPIRNPEAVAGVLTRELVVMAAGRDEFIPNTNVDFDVGLSVVRRSPSAHVSRSVRINVIDENSREEIGGQPFFQDAGWFLSRTFEGSGADDWSAQIIVRRIEYVAGADQPMTVSRNGRDVATLSPASRSFVPSERLSLIGTWQLRIPPRPSDPGGAPPMMTAALYPGC